MLILVPSCAARSFIARVSGEKRNPPAAMRAVSAPPTINESRSFGRRRAPGTKVVPGVSTGASCGLSLRRASAVVAPPGAGRSLSAGGRGVGGRGGVAAPTHSSPLTEGGTALLPAVSKAPGGGG